MIRVVLLRHGQSTWNLENRFTGWTDVDLTPQGTSEGEEAARLLIEGGYTFDVAYTSVLKRAIRTLWIVLDRMDLMWLPVHRHWRLTPENTMIGGIAGAMGVGVPGAIAASLAAPERMPIVVVGDGGALMTGQEIATAMQYGAKPKVVISNNGTYGTIRSHQEKHYPKRISGTDLVNPDFTAWAKSFGVHTVTIEPGDDVNAKVRDALAHDGASVIDVHSSQEAISAFATISGLRGA